MKKILITIGITFISSVIIGILPAILFYIPNQIEFAKLLPGVVNEEPEPHIYVTRIFISSCLVGNKF